MRMNYWEIRSDYQDWLFFLKEQNINKDLHPQPTQPYKRRQVTRQQKKNPFDNLRPF